MPINKTGLKKKFLSFMAKDNSLFLNFPDSTQDSINKMSDGLRYCCSSMIPFSTNLELSINIFKSTLLTLQNNNDFEVSINKIKLAFKNFSLIYSTGTIGWVSTPPLIDLMLNDLFSLMLDSKIEQEIYVDQLCDLICNWLKTGISINVQTGMVINWK